MPALIAQSCLYGVDKNPFAVNLARLSLWLVSLSKDAPLHLRGSRSQVR